MIDLSKIDSTGVALILSNLLVLFLALIYHWNLGVLVWGYGIETLIFGFFLILNGLRIVLSDQAASSRGIFIQSALGFIVIFGFYHFIYFMALSMQPLFRLALNDFVNLLLMSIILFASNLYSFLKISLSTPAKVPTLMDFHKSLTGSFRNHFPLLSSPLRRILPMHILIMVSAFTIAYLKNLPEFEYLILMVVFILLKTTIDLSSRDVKQDLAYFFVPQ